LNQAEADKVGAVLITEQRTLNPNIVGKSAEYIANLAGVSVPNGTRCLLADCGGVGRDFPWSFEKLSPTLAFFVADGIEAGARRCLEILQFGGMGHTAGMHTQSREAAVRYGEQMPASRVIINSPTTHGAIGFSTDLNPSMTLGCGSWGGNVTSDNVSPIHLMDIKRVAFETKPVNSSRSQFGSQSITTTEKENGQRTTEQRNIKREEIAALVDKFLRNKIAETPETVSANSQTETQAPKSESQNPVASPVKTIIHELKTEAASNGSKPKAADFVSETDVKKAIENGEKIYVTAKTIITPSARDLGEEREIFAKV
jgi:acetaldehyde dehydrogenase (acetylating)